MSASLISSSVRLKFVYLMDDSVKPIIFLWSSRYFFILSCIFSIFRGSRKLSFPSRRNSASSGAFPLCFAWIKRLSSMFFTQSPGGSNCWILSMHLYRSPSVWLLFFLSRRETGARKWKPLESRLYISFSHSSNSAGGRFSMFNWLKKCSVRDFLLSE